MCGDDRLGGFFGFGWQDGFRLANDFNCGRWFEHRFGFANCDNSGGFFFFEHGFKLHDYFIDGFVDGLVRCGGGRWFGFGYWRGW